MISIQVTLAWVWAATLQSHIVEDIGDYQHLSDLDCVLIAKWAGDQPQWKCSGWTHHQTLCVDGRRVRGNTGQRALANSTVKTYPYAPVVVVKFPQQISELNLKQGRSSIHLLQPGPCLWRCRSFCPNLIIFFCRISWNVLTVGKWGQSDYPECPEQSHCLRLCNSYGGGTEAFLCLPHNHGIRLL